MTKRYLEDFAIGQIFRSATYTVSAEQIKAFAREFDPQPFHIDEVQAENSFFKQLVASGWHTASISMRLTVESDLAPAGGIVGAGVDDLRFYKPVLPDDTLRVEIEVLGVKPSKSKPQQGMVTLKTRTFNQHNEMVASFLSNMVALTKLL